MIPEHLEPFLALLAVAAAMGLSAYAVLATLGIAGYFGLLELPSLLGGLVAPPIWGSLVGLLVIEWFASAYRISDLVWNVLHTLVRPLAAALLVAAGFSDQQALQWPLSLAGFSVALAIHIPVLAIRTAVRTAGLYRPLGPLVLTAAQSILAVGLSVLALLEPLYGAGAVALLLLLPLPWFRFVWGAASLALATAPATLADTSRARRWHVGSEGLPDRLRLVLEAELGSSLVSLRWTPAVLAHLGRRRPFYRGRLMLDPSGPRFAHRRWFRPALIPLKPAAGRVDDVMLIGTVRIEASVPYALCLTRIAPRVTAILAELEGAEGRGT